ncbi:MAG: 4-hydroxy-tetrahydrodipicolinate reductase [Magnetococcales bacterium]|nr:4-hydroxy-tetrahydrodipicolinate reductase [Magnetococcales bacterium]
MTKIGIIGVAGRMGRMLVEATHTRATAVADGETAPCALVAASDHAGCEEIGRDAGEVAGVGTLDVSIRTDNQTVLKESDVVIDFTLPAVTLSYLDKAVASKTPLVIGTTGFKPEEIERLRSAAQEIPIVFAPNFSVGVNLMFKVASEVAAILGEAFDIEIIEAHHRHKVDAPSGTAIGLGQAIAEAIDRNLDDVAVYAREGHTGPRESRSIGFATVRGGDIVGDHTALFAGDGERLEITHKASSRMTFANGAVRAALWVGAQSPGLYDMRDILGFRTNA